MKIVHIITSLGLGGIETMLVNTVNADVSRQHNISIIIINNNIDESLLKKIHQDVKIFKLNRTKGSINPVPIIKLNMLLASMDFDIVHFHWPNTYRYIFLPKLKNACVTMHEMCDKENSKRLPKFSHIFAISKAVQKDIYERYGLNSHLIYNSINTSLIEPSQKVYNNEDVFKIVQVSRLSHETKGQDILIKAAKILIDKGEKIHITFIGGGPSMDYLKKLSTENGIESFIEFKGNQPNYYVAKHLKDYNLLVQPSYNEGFGLTIVEGMTAKVPVLISDIEGPMEVINNGEYGFYFRKGDVTDCADMIEKIIKQDNTTIIAKAYQCAKEKFDITRTSTEYSDYYKKIQTNK